MGDENFSVSKMEEYNDILIQFVLGHFKDNVILQHGNMSANEELPHVQQESLVDTWKDDVDDLFVMGLLRAGANVNVTHHDVSLETMMNDCKKQIQEEFTSYVGFCKKIKWHEILVRYGTEKYEKEVREKTFDPVRCDVSPRYTRTLFDVVGWWSNQGFKLFPKLVVAALIILSKAAHNGFQERVFSIGTFLDTKQQKRREARHYEMDVLQRINNGIMLEEEYSEILKTSTTEENDKAGLQSFFEVTEAIQAIQASKAHNETHDDSSELLRNDDDVSIDVSILSKEEDTSNRKEVLDVEWEDIASSDED